MINHGAAGDNHAVWHGFSSQTCQRKDWKKHKPACDEMKRSQEQGADSAKPVAAEAAEPQASSEDEVAPVPKLVLHPYSSFLKHFSNSDATKGKPTGLMNHGNTCYANSILQCLLYSRPLASYLLSREHTKGCKTSGVLQQLQAAHAHELLVVTGGSLCASLLAGIRHASLMA
jgi:ubiquitin C-terminal hydrolase